MICNKLKDRICNFLRCSESNTDDKTERSNGDFIEFDDFAKLDLKVGKVKDASEVEGSDKLIKTIVSFGDEEKVVVSGIKKYKKPEDLIGKKFVYIVNLPPRKIFGIESQAMILAATDDNQNLTLVSIEDDIKEGAKIS